MTGAITPARHDVSVRVLVAVACLVGAQFLHWSVIDAHAREWAAAGTFFFALALAEGLCAALLLVHQRRWVIATAIAVSIVPMLVWVIDRSLGLPFGPTPGVRGTIGRSDVLSVVFEAMTIIALAPLLRRSSDPGTRPISLVGRIVIVAMCAYVAAFAYWSIFGDLARTHLR